MGLPFTTRLAKSAGLYCPKDCANWVHFICEACTVRAVTQREIAPTALDAVYLMLERARLIDTANHWARGTLATYQSKYRIITDFERDLKLPVLQATKLTVPPHGPAIRMMWAQERYSLYPSDWYLRAGTHDTTVKFGSIRALRSAASHFWILDLLHTKPSKLTLGYKDRPLVVEGCSPTAEAAVTYFSDGLRRRLGDNPKPSVVLLIHHMQWLADYYEQLYRQATSPLVRTNACRAAVTHLMSYLGWLRALETFGVRWGDVALVEPADGPTVGLPTGIGVVLLTLLAQTKSSQTATADVVIAYTTVSGLSLGTWLHRLRACLNPRELQPDSFVIASPSGVAWSSHHYRYTYLYPALSVLRATGDAYLRKYDGSPGKTLQAALWGFNTQRRTGRSVVSKKRATTSRKATPAEEVEHGRWRLSRSSLSMPLAYLEWSLEDRFCITFFCM